MNRLAEKYKQEVAPKLKEQFGYDNVHQIPKLVKVVVNVGAGRAVTDAKLLEAGVISLTSITGQAPVQTVAKKSIAGFKLREGQKIGAKVTLRGTRMHEFLDRLVSVVLPRIRDFRGLSADAFDPQGNYSIGLREQSIFPEISFDVITMAHGLQINVVTTAKTKAEGVALLRGLGFPLRESK